MLWRIYEHWATLQSASITFFHCIVLYCIVWYCIVLYCIVLYSYSKIQSMIFWHVHFCIKYCEGSCALYLHCAALLKDLLLRIASKTAGTVKTKTSQSVSSPENSNQIMIDKMQQVSEVKKSRWMKLLLSMIWFDMTWYNMIWYDVIWHDMIWFDMT